MVFQNPWKEVAVMCIKSGRLLKIFYDDPPDDCDFLLEHLMENQDKTPPEVKVSSQKTHPLFSHPIFSKRRRRRRPNVK